MPSPAVTHLAVAVALSSLAHPLASQQWHAVLPVPRTGHALAFDVFRNRTVLFGGSAAAQGLDLRRDTWEFDGSSWREVPITGPSAREWHALVYDAVRARTVLFGGTNGNQILGDTWEYDGTTWTQIQTTTAPVARAGHGMTADLPRAVVVLFGGSDAGSNMRADTWEYNGTWHPVATAHAPLPRAFHGLAHDLARGRTVLFGGHVFDSVTGFSMGDDTWEYDGVDWARAAPNTSPPGRMTPAMAYDAPGARTLLFGGTGGSALDDTWSYDGTDWQRLAVPGPSTRSSTAIACDLSRGRTVLFGGVDALDIFAGDTWELSGTTWTPVAGAATPSPRVNTALVHDLARGRTVLFGGDLRGTLLADTWERAGAAWQRIATAAVPPARFGHALGYDPARARVLLFGGQGQSAGTALLNDTWEYDGVNWTPVATAASPPARVLHALGHDLARGRTVLFGGVDTAGALADTWEYDGATWHQQVTTPAPAARMRHGLAYDAARARTVLFGGMTGFAARLGDTWEYDGATWRAVAPIASPTPRYGHAMVYDPTRARTLLSGGFTTTLAGDAFEYDGSTWTPLVLPADVGARQQHALVYDQGRDRVVLFGGNNGSLLGDTWELERAAAPTCARHGSGCAGSNGVPALDAAPGALPALGTTFTLQLASLPGQPGFALLALGTDLVRWNGALLPLPLDPIGVPGCMLWIGPAQGASVLLAHAGNSAALALPIPANPALADMLVGAQAFAFDPAAPSGLGAVSNGVILRLY